MGGARRHAVVFASRDVEFMKELDEYNNVLNYNKEHLESSYDKIVKRVKLNQKKHPMPKQVAVTKQAITRKYEELRKARNKSMSKEIKNRKTRLWPSWGSIHVETEAED